MKKVIAISILVLVLTGCASFFELLEQGQQQERQQRQRKLGIEPATTNGIIKVRYDDFTGETTFSLKRMILQNHGRDGMQPGIPTFLELDAIIYKGSNDIAIMISSVSSMGWRYLECNHINWLLDDKPFKQFHGAKHSGQVLSGGHVAEYITQYFTKQEFLDLTEAKKVRGRLCNTEFSLTPEQITAFHSLAEIGGLIPAAQVPLQGSP